MRFTAGHAKTLFGLLVVASLLPAVGRTEDVQHAQPLPKIAIIDTEQVLLGSQAGKQALADLKRLQETKEAEGRDKASKLKDLQTRLAETRAGLSQPEIEELTRQIEGLTNDLRSFQDAASRELNQRRDGMLGSIDQQVMPVINQIGKEQGYTLIFRKFESGLIYADDSIDITATVIQRLDSGGVG